MAMRKSTTLPDAEDEAVHPTGILSDLEAGSPVSATKDSAPDALDDAASSFHTTDPGAPARRPAALEIELPDPSADLPGAARSTARPSVLSFLKAGKDTALTSARAVGGAVAKAAGAALCVDGSPKTPDPSPEATATAAAATTAAATEGSASTTAVTSDTALTSASAVGGAVAKAAGAALCVDGSPKTPDPSPAATATAAATATTAAATGGSASATTSTPTTSSGVSAPASAPLLGAGLVAQIANPARRAWRKAPLAAKAIFFFLVFCLVCIAVALVLKEHNHGNCGDLKYLGASGDGTSKGVLKGERRLMDLDQSFGHRSLCSEERKELGDWFRAEVAKKAQKAGILLDFGVLTDEDSVRLISESIRQDDDDDDDDDAAVIAHAASLYVDVQKDKQVEDFKQVAVNEEELPESCVADLPQHAILNLREKILSLEPNERSVTHRAVELLEKVLATEIFLENDILQPDVAFDTFHDEFPLYCFYSWLQSSLEDESWKPDWAPRPSLKPIKDFLLALFKKADRVPDRTFIDIIRGASHHVDAAADVFNALKPAKGWLWNELGKMEVSNPAEAMAKIEANELRNKYSNLKLSRQKAELAKAAEIKREEFANKLLQDKGSQDGRMKYQMWVQAQQAGDVVQGFPEPKSLNPEDRLLRASALFAGSIHEVTQCLDEIARVAPGQVPTTDLDMRFSKLAFKFPKQVQLFKDKTKDYSVALVPESKYEDGDELNEVPAPLGVADICKELVRQADLLLVEVEQVEKKLYSDSIKLWKQKQAKLEKQLEVSEVYQVRKNEQVQVNAMNLQKQQVDPAKDKSKLVVATNPGEQQVQVNAANAMNRREQQVEQLEEEFVDQPVDVSVDDIDQPDQSAKVKKSPHAKDSSSTVEKSSQEFVYKEEVKVDINGVEKVMHVKNIRPEKENQVPIVDVDAGAEAFGPFGERSMSSVDSGKN